MVKISKLFTARDMTEGTPWKRILEFSIPMLIGNIAQHFIILLTPLLSAGI